MDSTSKKDGEWLHAVADPGADAVHAVIVGFWRDRQRLNGNAPPNLELDRLSA